MDELGIDEVMQQALAAVEAQADYPEALLFVNYEYLARPEGIFDELIFDAQYKGYDTVFPGFVDYAHYWFRAEDGQFQQTDTSMKARTERQPIFRALYGLGCLTSAMVLRKGQMIGGKIGMLPINNFQCTLRAKDIETEFGPLQKLIR